MHARRFEPRAAKDALFHAGFRVGASPKVTILTAQNYVSDEKQGECDVEASANDLVRATWAKAAAVHVDMARLFYGRLFKIAPETRKLFKSDIEQQGRKLVATLGFVIDHLSDEAALAPAARDLAIRHLTYNVEKEHYAAVGQALLWTFEELLGPEYTPDVAAAWTDIYSQIENIMTEAAYPQPT